MSSTYPAANERPHFPITLSHLDRAKTMENAKAIVLKLRPNWTQANIDEAGKELLNFQYFTEGITNTILCVWSKLGDPDDRILLRIYGEKTELIIDREAEKRNMILLNRHGCGAPLYGTFDNGVIYGYIPGRVLNTEDVSDPHLAELIARAMAKMHTIGMAANDQSGDQELSRSPVLLSKISEYIGNMPTRFDDPAKQRRFETEFPSKNELLAEFASIRDKVDQMKSPVVFCHNDLLVKNLVYDSTKDEVFFIDYEYASFSYQAFDIGDHFGEYSGVEEKPDYSLFPNDEYQKWWLKHYLQYWRKFTNGPPPTERDVEILFIQTNVFAPMAHFWWSIWSMIQARHSTIDFDFIQYGIGRMNEYKRLKARSWDWTIR